MSVRTDNSMLCLGCGFDLSDTPKIRRNLGTNSKGCSTVVRERVLCLWKDLASRIQQNIVLDDNNSKMCRRCFNDYDKFAIKKAELDERLQMAIAKLNPPEAVSNTVFPVHSTPRKRPSEGCQPAAQKRVVGPPLVIPSNEQSSPCATVSANI